MKFDYLVLGNGAVGMFSAIQIKRAFPSSKIGIVGHPERINSASVAAGAMCNVYGELEYSYSDQMRLLQNISFQYGVSGKNGWLEFVKDFNLENQLVTAKDTLIFLKSNPSEFEVRNFSKAKSESKDDSVLRSVTNSDMHDFFSNVEKKPADAFYVESEFAMDTKQLFKIFSLICSSLGIEIIGDSIVQIDTSSKLVVTEQARISSNKFIVALGAETRDLLPDNNIQQILRGVGTAIEISTEKINAAFGSGKSVVRTVNRGGAQCGFHFVPRRSGYYLGAGNYIKNSGASFHRLETIRYLINTFERELAGTEITYLIEGDIIKGHRPRALDGFPLIGPLSQAPDFFAVSGTNRAGLTWAPAIASQIVSWCKEKDQSILPVEFAKILLPDREPISFGAESEAIEYYVESRVGAAIEHGRVGNEEEAIEMERVRLTDYASQLLSDVQKVSGAFRVPHPDHWASIMDTPSLCFP
jgi:glycine oxidase